MPSKIAEIAEAVLAALNAAGPGTFSMTFTPMRKYLPLQKLEEGSLIVSVVPRTEVRQSISRTHVQREISIDIGIRKRLTQAADPLTDQANPELDALVFFAEQIAGFFRAGKLGSTGAVWLR